MDEFGCFPDLAHSLFAHAFSLAVDVLKVLEIICLPLLTSLDIESRCMRTTLFKLII